MPQFHDIGHYQFSSDDRLFFDTNIWITLFDCRTNPDRRENPNFVNIYGGALKRATTAKSQLFTHPFVVSEFINRMVHDEHRFQVGLGVADKNFKAWRRSTDYRNFAPIVAAQTRAFTSSCTLIEHSFDSGTFGKCLLAFEEDSCDLNDELLLQICKDRRLTFVTHDGDFQQADIPVLTANPAYLRRTNAR